MSTYSKLFSLKVMKPLAMLALCCDEAVAMLRGHGAGSGLSDPFGDLGNQSSQESGEEASAGKAMDGGGGGCTRRSGTHNNHTNRQGSALRPSSSTIPAMELTQGLGVAMPAEMLDQPAVQPVVCDRPESNGNVASFKPVPSLKGDATTPAPVDWTSVKDVYTDDLLRGLRDEGADRDCAAAEKKVGDTLAQAYKNRIDIMHGADVAGCCGGTARDIKHVWAWFTDFWAERTLTIFRAAEVTIVNIPCPKLRKGQDGPFKVYFIIMVVWVFVAIICLFRAGNVSWEQAASNAGKSVTDFPTAFYKMGSSPTQIADTYHLNQLPGMTDGAQHFAVGDIVQQGHHGTNVDTPVTVGNLSTYDKFNLELGDSTNQYEALSAASTPRVDSLHMIRYFVKGVNDDNTLVVKLLPLVFVCIISFPFLMAFKLRGLLDTAQSDIENTLFKYDRDDNPVGKHDFTCMMAWEVFWIGKTWMFVRVGLGMLPFLKQYFKPPTASMDSALFLVQELFLVAFGVIIAPTMSMAGLVTLTPKDALAANTERKWIILECFLKTVINFIITGAFLQGSMWKSGPFRTLWSHFAAFSKGTYIFVQMGFHIFLDVCQQLALLAVTKLANAGAAFKKSHCNRGGDDDALHSIETYKSVRHETVEIIPAGEERCEISAMVICRVFKKRHEWNVPFERCLRKLLTTMLIKVATEKEFSADNSLRAKRAILRLHDLNVPMDTFRDSRGLFGWGDRCDGVFFTIIGVVGVVGGTYGLLTKALGYTKA